MKWQPYGVKTVAVSVGSCCTRTHSSFANFSNELETDAFLSHESNALLCI
ncbi:hypothetical protein OROGR_005604 [Orobanche gracilis]